MRTFASLERAFGMLPAPLKLQGGGLAREAVNQHYHLPVYSISSGVNKQAATTIHRRHHRHVVPWSLGASALGTLCNLAIVLSNTSLRIDREADIRVLHESRLQRRQQVARIQALRTHGGSLRRIKKTRPSPVGLPTPDTTPKQPRETKERAKKLPFVEVVEEQQERGKVSNKSRVSNNRTSFRLPSSSTPLFSDALYLRLGFYCRLLGAPYAHSPLCCLVAASLLPPPSLPLSPLLLLPKLLECRVALFVVSVSFRRFRFRFSHHQLSRVARIYLHLSLVPLLCAFASMFIRPPTHQRSLSKQQHHHQVVHPLPHAVPFVRHLRGPNTVRFSSPTAACVALLFSSSVDEGIG